MNYYDVGVYFPLSEEFEYFKQLLKEESVTLEPRDLDDETGNAGFEFCIDLPSGDRDPIRCIAIYGVSAGQDSAETTTEYILKSFSPTAVALIGIAGLLGDDAKLGDVVIPDEVDHSNAYGKIKGNHVHVPRTSLEPTSRLSHRANTLQDRSPDIWEALVQKIATDRAELRTQIGDVPCKEFFGTRKFQSFVRPIASGNNVVASDVEKARLIDSNRKVLAVETEAIGFLKAVKRRGTECESIIVRGISDGSDSDKESLENSTDNLVRRHALRNAARIFIAMVQSGDFSQVPTSPTVSTKGGGADQPNSADAARATQFIVGQVPDITVKTGPFSPDELSMTEQSEGLGQEIIYEATKQIGSSNEFERELARRKRQRKILESTIQTLRRTVVGRDDDNVNPFNIAELQAMYTAIAIISGPELYASFTRESFADKEWQDLIEVPQEIGSSSNHLHKSNTEISTYIAQDLHKRWENGEFRSGSTTIRLLETGSGGCNTTYAVVQAILKSFEQWLPADQLKIQYLGFEVNKSFADRGNALFRGMSWPGIESDARIALNDRRVVPWPSQNGRFVECADAAQSVPKLISERKVTLESVDYFFSSYMMHHVPNGDALLRFLLGPKLKVQEKLVNLQSPEFTERFVHRMIVYLRNMLESGSSDTDAKRIEKEIKLADRASKANDRSLINAVGYSLACHLYDGGSICNENDIQYLSGNIFRTMEEAGQSQHGLLNPYGSEWAKDFYKNPQSVLFLALKSLLKPNGMLLVADPDGTSMFNRENAAKKGMIANELMIAEFRSLERLADVLSSRPLYFSIERSSRVVKVHDNSIDVLDGTEVLKHRDISDPNLGYLIAARKPLIHLL